MKLKELRKAMNKTQKDLAKELNISLQSCQNYELGYRKPDYETLIRIADYFHTTVDNLLEHDCQYNVDISLLNDAQIRLINKIKNCNEKT